MKKVSLIFVLFALVSTVLFLYMEYRPVKVIAVHHAKYGASVLVDRFPLTSKGKIKWWLMNKARLNQIYQLPQPADNERFNISIWLFGDGYKEMEKYDRLCFNDMPPPVNCIEKDRVMRITLTRDKEVMYWLSSGMYIEKPNGKLYRKDFD